MKVSKITLQNFRNIEKESIVFKPGVNLLLGDNAQGKTNVIEAIYYFARGKSFRAGKEIDCVRFGEDFFSLSLDFSTADREKNFSVRMGKTMREKEKNGVKIEKISEMIGEFRAVLFCPENLSLIKGGPEERRDFLNVAISQCYPAYIPVYASYRKLLENRNILLKMIQKGYPVEREEVLVFSEKMAEEAARIYEYRRKYIEKLSEYAGDILCHISGKKEKMELFYESDIKNGEDPFPAYRRLLTENLEKEASVGCSLYGVQRDDMDIRINEKSSRLFASQGQQRSLVLALKEAEGEVSRFVTGEYPVFLYDDVLSELDEQRQKYLLKENQDKQILITACNRSFSGSAVQNEIFVEGGRYVSSYRER